MQNQIIDKEIEYMRSKLLLAKEKFNDNKWGMDADELWDEIFDILSEIGDREIYELKKEVYGLLECKNNSIRAEAVKTLGYSSRLALPEFKQLSYDIWQSDSSKEVKLAALIAWSDYYNSTNDSSVLIELYLIFMNNLYEMNIRVVACISFLIIPEESYFSDLELENFMDKIILCYTEESMVRMIPWNYIFKILNEFAPDFLKTHTDEIQKIENLIENSNIFCENKKMRDFLNTFQEKSGIKIDENTIEIDEDTLGMLDNILKNIAKNKIYSFKDEIINLLKSKNSFVRSYAVEILGNSEDGLFLPEVKHIAYKLWQHDPDLIVRFNALKACFTFWEKTDDEWFLGEIYKSIFNDREEYPIRICASANLFRVFSFLTVKAQLDARRVFKLWKKNDSPEKLAKPEFWQQVLPIVEPYFRDYLSQFD